MVQKVTVQLFDDLDGGEAAETVGFGLDGIAYEIDLSEANAANLRDALAKFVKAGRRQDSRRRGKSKPTAARPSNNGPAIREWAASQGIEVATRGRVPAEIVEKYEKAHS
ncbi:MULTISPECIES: Lsr2 family protein [Kitasatospora]|uniref:Putative LSR2-like protein n=1 Tax=Kitasatospora setae (strain ATCC 33774 / DSM 43861 / JCM 3304 / KCC A-0304 / NBRC 14216 / KM-6054) TaxID=452652 RepID=E4NHM9_KITSK|nr:Lsr2 family protein [Kitasatospora setae]BAJ31009.1 putative LSR2-like protein [Kitasatospora setae KM-6054]